MVYNRFNNTPPASRKISAPRGVTHLKYLVLYFLNKISFQKPPLDYSQQVALMQSRGLKIDCVDTAVNCLSHFNYYRFSAYLRTFEVDPSSHQIQLGTTFDDVLNVYLFDRDLRLLMLDAIEQLEVSLRTQLAYQLSHRYGAAHPHLQADLFSNQSSYVDGFVRLENEVKHSSEDFIRHLRTKYKEDLPPIWAVVELMTVGQLSRWFSNIKLRSDRRLIASIYAVDEKILSSFFEHLSLVRNFAAHHSRLWNREFTKTMKIPRYGDPFLVSSFFHLPDHDRRLRKIYNTLTISGYLLQVISSNKDWIRKIKQLVAAYPVDVSKMGFPKDWLSRPVWLCV